MHYAIADVASFVTPGDPVDIEAHRRGETLYGADSQGAAAPHRDVGGRRVPAARPGPAGGAVVPDLDATGEGTAVTVERALVRSRAQLTYDQVQASIDDGSADEVFGLLREVGTLRLEREARNGGGVAAAAGAGGDIVEDGWQLDFRAQHPVEEWNAQLSLLTGMAAAT